MIRIEGIGELSRRLKPAAERVDRFDWQRIARDLDQQGNAMMEQLLSPEECRAIAGLYPNDDVFRSRIVMDPLSSGYVEGAQKPASRLKVQKAFLAGRSIGFTKSIWSTP